MSATPPLLGSVVDRLGAEIVGGDIAEGERFRLGDVEKRFGISRTVAREAMRTLEHLGMVRSGRRVESRCCRWIVGQYMTRRSLVGG